MNYQLPKSPHDVRGYQISCINFEMCPICYGCRNYDSSSLECSQCLSQGYEGKRNKNVCNKELHKADVINKMITKEKTYIKGEL